MVRRRLFVSRIDITVNAASHYFEVDARHDDFGFVRQLSEIVRFRALNKICFVMRQGGRTKASQRMSDG
jgi:hypothetical protein